MASSLLNFVYNVSEGIHKIKCKYRHDDTKCETFESIMTVFLDTQVLEMI